MLIAPVHLSANSKFLSPTPFDMLEQDLVLLLILAC